MGNDRKKGERKKKGKKEKNGVLNSVIVSKKSTERILCRMARTRLHCIFFLHGTDLKHF
jgi:hypothetical protein